MGASLFGWSPFGMSKALEEDMDNYFKRNRILNQFDGDFQKLKDDCRTFIGGFGLLELDPKEIERIRNQDELDYVRRSRACAMLVCDNPSFYNSKTVSQAMDILSDTPGEEIEWRDE